MCVYICMTGLKLRGMCVKLKNVVRGSLKKNESSYVAHTQCVRSRSCHDGSVVKERNA